jgi:NAD(P)-dependent dehydrogenase (short-subunit alcohol dehydrogenase family)
MRRAERTLQEIDGHVSRGSVTDRLAGKVALVTGAGQGQGQETALLFARAGASVVACDVNPFSVKNTRERAATENLAVEIKALDVTEEQAVEDWVSSAAQRHGGIDILYNNASFTHFAPISEMTLEQWRETLRLELDVVFIPTRAVWRHLVARGGGSIINIASVSGMRATELLGASAHAAGKSGVIGFTRQLALEGAPHWIRANSISPGPIVTPTIEALLESTPKFRELLEGLPLLARTGGTPDVAYAGLFLASDESTYVTGVNLPVDGGWTAKGGMTPH